MPHVAVVALLGVAAAAVGLLGLAWLRWQYLKARPGCFPCSGVEGAGPARRERAGLASFTPVALEWFARNSLNPAAAHRWPRRGLTIKARELAPGSKAGWQVVQLAHGASTCLLVLSRSASSGLLSWIEAGPTRSDSVM
jgi:hypothetical protein